MTALAHCGVGRMDGTTLLLVPADVKPPPALISFDGAPGRLFLTRFFPRPLVSEPVARAEVYAETPSLSPSRAVGAAHLINATSAPCGSHSRSMTPP